MLSRVRLFATPWIVDYQAPPSWDFLGVSPGLPGIVCFCLSHGLTINRTQPSPSILKSIPVWKVNYLAILFMEKAAFKIVFEDRIGFQKTELHIMEMPKID